MHPSLQQRVDRVAALRARTNTATVAFYARIGKKPVQKMRYHAATQSKAQGIIELASRKVHGFRWTRKEAANFTRPLDARTGSSELFLTGARP